MGLQKADQGRRWCQPGGKPDFPAPAFCAHANDMARIGQHIGDAARDGWRWVEPRHRPWRKRIQLVKQKRIMGAAQHHDIGSGAALAGEGGRDLAGDGLLVHVRAAGMRLGQAWQAWARQPG